MIEHDLIDPIIFFKPGQCPYCSGVLMVVDSEISCLLLGSDGMPIREETMIRCEGTCQSCGKIFPMMRDGFGYRKKSLSYRLFQKFDHKRNFQQTNVNGNPFVEK